MFSRFSSLRFLSSAQTVPAKHLGAKPLPSHRSRTFISPSNPAFKLGKLNHVAIATLDLEKSISLYRDILGGNVSAPKDQPDHGVTTVFIDLGNSKLELLHPLGENSPIGKFLEKKPEGGIHHICIEVDDVYAAVKDLKAKGVKVIDPEPKIGAHGKPVVFLHPKSMGGILVELEQA